MFPALELALFLGALLAELAPLDAALDFDTLHLGVNVAIRTPADFLVACFAGLKEMWFSFELEK